jgi:hypothetical protein
MDLTILSGLPARLLLVELAALLNDDVDRFATELMIERNPPFLVKSQ